MKKLDVGRVRTRFTAALAGLDAALHKSSGLPAAESKAAAESALLSATVMWEGFVHELFVAYINRDSVQLRRELHNRIGNGVKAKHGALIARHVSLALPKHLTRAQVEEALGHDGFNLSFSSAEQMVTRAGEWLPSVAAKRFRSLSTSDLELIDLWKAVRNVLAHRSPSARKALNEALVAPHLWPRMRRGQRAIHDVGSHFAAHFRQTKPRRDRSLLRSMSRIASRL